MVDVGALVLSPPLPLEPIKPNGDVCSHSHSHSHSHATDSDDDHCDGGGGDHKHKSGLFGRVLNLLNSMRPGSDLTRFRVNPSLTISFSESILFFFPFNFVLFPVLSLSLSLSLSHLFCLLSSTMFWVPTLLISFSTDFCLLSSSLLLSTIYCVFWWAV